MKRKYLLGLHRTVELGYSLEFKDIRKYIPGDIVKFIDWKATARRGDLMIREYHREVENDVIFIIKLSIGMMAGRLGNRKYDYVVDTIAKIAMSMVNTSDRLGIVIFGSGNRLIHPLKRVRLDSLKNILDLLASIPFELTDFSGDIGDIGELMGILGVRGKALIIFITDLEDEKDVELVRILITFKHTVYVISPSTTRFVVEDMDERERFTFEILRYREDRIRRDLIDRLLSFDVLALDVGPDTILDEIFGKMSRFRRLTPT